MFLVSLCTDRCWVDLGFLEIGFVLRIKGRFVERALQLSRNVKMGHIVK